MPKLTSVKTEGQGEPLHSSHPNVVKKSLLTTFDAWNQKKQEDDVSTPI